MFTKLKIDNSWLKTLVFVLILAFYGSFLVHKINLPVADDLPRQIKIGEEVIHGNFDILYKNTFSYTEPEQTFYNHHWFSGVIFYLVHQVVGWGGLVIFKTIILLLAFSLLFFTAKKKADFWLVSALSIPTVLILIERTTLRPEVFSYLFITIFLYFLVSFEENPKSKKIFWLIPLQLLWVNMHVFFSIGIMLVGGFFLEKLVVNFKSIKNDFRNTIKNNILIRSLGILLFSVILVSFINPRGFEGVFYSYPQNFPVHISENTPLLDYKRSLPPWEDISVSLFIPAVFLLCFSFVVGFKRRRSFRDLPMFYFLAGVSTIFIGFVLLRGISLFALMFLPVASLNFSQSFIDAKEYLQKNSVKIYGVLRKVLIVLFIGTLLYCVLPSTKRKISEYKDYGVGLSHNSLRAIDFFKEQDLQGPIFNDADFGSYVIYNLYPKEKVFVDNRFADAYSSSFFANTYLSMMQNDEFWKKKLEEYNFNVIFFYQYDGGPYTRDFLWRRMRDPEWSLIYADNYSLIFVRNIKENKEVIKKFEINRDNVGERLDYLVKSERFDNQVAAADIFNLFGRTDLGSEMFLSITNRWPEKGHIWMTMGDWELTIGDRKSRILTMMYLERAILVGYKTAETYNLLGKVYERLGYYEKAKEALKKSLELDPHKEDARQLYHQLTN